MANRAKRTNPILFIILGTLILLALAGAIIYAAGYRYINTDGEKFTGFVYDGQPVRGSVSYSDGTKGDFRKDKTSAFGTVTYSTGDVYEGTFNGVMRHGKGKITYKASGDVYEGDFVNDKRTGNAVITYASGDVYEGQVKDGRMDGKGKYTFADGSWYSGEFTDNMKNGVGEYHWSDGSYYYGAYKNDKRHGSEVVTVELTDGMMYTGKNKLVFACGDEYVGDFLDDARTGNGTYTWANGEKYEGAFVNGVLEGTGTYSFSGGSVYTGLFSNGTIVDTDAVATDVQTPEAQGNNNEQTQQ